MPKKRILLFSDLFYDYWKLIKEALERQGYEVDFLTYRVNKIRGGLLTFASEEKRLRVYDKIVDGRIKKLKGGYDYLIVIKGHYFSKANLDLIKKENPGIKTIMYQWDSLERFDYLEFSKQFDVVKTFDSRDAEEYGFEYLPLFYTRDIQQSIPVEEDIDLLLIGIYHPWRNDYLKRLKSLKGRLNVKSVLVVSPSLYIREELFTHKLGLESSEDFRHTPIKREDLLDLYRRSKVFVDVCKGQTGMSMRTVEAYGMNKKLLTGNSENINKDPYISELMTLPLEATDDEIVEFVKTKTPSYRQREKFSIDQWVKTLMK